MARTGERSEVCEKNRAFPGLSVPAEAMSARATVVATTGTAINRPDRAEASDAGTSQWRCLSSAIIVRCIMYLFVMNDSNLYSHNHASP